MKMQMALNCLLRGPNGSQYSRCKCKNPAFLLQLRHENKFDAYGPEYVDISMKGNVQMRVLLYKYLLRSGSFAL